jgi:predicted transcriptional regulator
LQDRGLVVSEKSNHGKAFVFRASRPLQVRNQLVKSFLDRVFDGCGLELVSTLLRSKSYSDVELDQLQDLIDSLRSDQKNVE